MGTRGLRVYRRRGKFFAFYNHSDSYPAGLGVEMVESIPRDPSEYAAWLEKTRAEYDRLLEGKSELSGEDKSNSLEIHETRPTTDLFVEYVYEIDLDDEVFWMNAMPMFRLDRMPSPEVFLEVRGRDSYGHYVPKPSMPAEHACQIPAPSQTPSAEDLSAYTSFLKHPSASPVAADVCTLLGVSEELSPSERIRIALYEVMAGGLMSIAVFKTVLLNAQLARSPSTHQPWITQTAKKLVVRAFVPMVFHSDVELSVEDRVAELEDESGAGGLLWLTPDVCFGAGFYLDYDDHLRAAVGKMVRDIHETPSAKGVIYGALCSVFHIVIVKVDKAPGGSFEHTPALQFLPSRFTESPSTPGITALLRLAFREDSTLCETVLSKSPFTSEPPAESPTFVDRLPPELITRVASFIPDLRSLLAFATLSDSTKARVSPELRFPFVGTHHLFGSSVREDQPLRQRLRSRTFSTRNDDGDAHVCHISGARLVRMPWETKGEVKGCFGMFTRGTMNAVFVLAVEEGKA